MLSVIFSLYICYTTIKAFCTDIRVISLFHVYIMPLPGIEPWGCLTIKSEVLPTELFGPYTLNCLKTYINLMMCLTM